MSNIPNFEIIETGPLKGCYRMNWSNWWGFAILIIVGIYSFAIPTIIKLSLLKWNYVAFCLYPLAFILAVSFFAPWCGLESSPRGASIQMILNFIIVGLVYLAGFLNWQKGVFLTSKGPLGTLMNTRLFKPVQSWWATTDFYLIGPINEFLGFSIMDWLGFIILLAWAAISAWARWYDLMDPTYGDEYNFGGPGYQSELLAGPFKPCP